MTFKNEIDIVSYNVSEYVIVWSFYGEKTADLSPTIFVSFHQ